MAQDLIDTILDHRVITEILKHLRYRYELSERVLTHHAKLAADTMVGKALEMWRDALVVELATDRLRAGKPESPLWPAGLVPEDVLHVLELIDKTDQPL